MFSAEAFRASLALGLLLVSSSPRGVCPFKADTRKLKVDAEERLGTETQRCSASREVVDPPGNLSRKTEVVGFFFFFFSVQGSFGPCNVLPVGESGCRCVSGLWLKGGGEEELLPIGCRCLDFVALYLYIYSTTAKERK